MSLCRCHDDCDCYDTGYRDGVNERVDRGSDDVVYATIKSPEAAYHEWLRAERERKHRDSLRSGLMRFAR